MDLDSLNQRHLIKELQLELEVPPQRIAHVLRAPDLTALRLGRPRTAALRMIWHDTPEASLADDGLALCERRQGRETIWRLEALRSRPAAPSAPGAPPPPLAQAPDTASLGRALPAPLLPVAAWDGVLRSLPLAPEAGPLRISVQDGRLRAVAGERADCRLLLAGSRDAVVPLALSLATQAALGVPRAALAAEAFAVAGRAAPTLAAGAPELPDGLTAGAAFARIAAHLAGVLHHWAPAAAAGVAPEPVHQMRVAVRRLRSAISLFRRAVACAELDVVHAALRALMRVLGPARDWDVFTSGIGRTVQEAFADDRAVARLLAAAERRRHESYAALSRCLGGAEFRLLGIRLACLASGRPWEDSSDPAGSGEDTGKPAAMDMPLPEFATHALTRRLARLRAAGDDLALLPPEALHRVRIQAKRLRYAGEFFAPLYPPRATRRFLRRVSDVQDRLGRLNDGTVAQDLLAQLGGGARGYAAGVVCGYVAAGLGGGRGEAARSWKKLRRSEPFWG